MRVFDPRGVYTPAQVTAALQAQDGTRQIEFIYRRLNASNVFIDNLNEVISCSVANAQFADIKRTAKFTIKAGGAVNYLSDRIQPVVRLLMPDGGYVEWSQGIFLLATPSRTFQDGSYAVRDVEGYDQLLVLSDDKIENRFTAMLGAVYTTVIASVLPVGMITNITPSTLVLPNAMEWEPGTSKLQIVNDLLNAMNYESAFFDEDGKLICRPYVAPATRAPEYTYATDTNSLISGNVDQTLDLFSVANKFVLVVSDGDRPPLTSSYTNTSISSPTSTVSRGRVITDFRTEQDAADQLTLDAKVARIAAEASQVYEFIEFETALMPVHQNADVFTVTVDGINVNNPYAETEWSMDLEAGGRMSHRVRRIIGV